MPELFDYISAAMQNSQCKSERKLCELLDLKPVAITKYRRGTLPSNETMMKLAKLAGVPEWQALLDLQEWKAENANEKAVWQNIRLKLGKSANILLTVAILSAASTPALAAEKCQDIGQTVYIMVNKVSEFINKIRILLTGVNQHRYA